MNFFAEELREADRLGVLIRIHAMTTRGEDVILCELRYDEGAEPNEGQLMWEAEKARRIYQTRNRVEFL